MDKSYYEILNVKRDADLKEIRVAYSKLVKKYPPERYPDEFNLIAKAYEALKDEDFRNNYSEFKGFKKEEQGLLDKALSLYEEARYEEAIIFFKKFLILEKGNNFVKNKLSRSYYLTGQYDLAYRLGSEIIESKESQREDYYLDFYSICQKLKRYEEGEKCLLYSQEEFKGFYSSFLLFKKYVEESNRKKACEILRDKVTPSFKREEVSFFDILYLENKSFDLSEHMCRETYEEIIVRECEIENFHKVFIILEKSAYSLILLKRPKEALNRVSFMERVLKKFIREGINLDQYLGKVLFYKEIIRLLEEKSISRTLLNYIIYSYGNRFYEEEIFSNFFKKEQVDDHCKRIMRDFFTFEDPLRALEDIKKVKEECIEIYHLLNIDLEGLNYYILARLEYEKREEDKRGYEKNIHKEREEEDKEDLKKTFKKAFKRGCLFALIGGILGGYIGAIIGFFIGLYI